MADSEGFAQDATADLTQELARLRAQNAALHSRLRIRTAMRRWLGRVLVVLSSLLVVTSTVAVWAYQTALDTDRFTAAVEPALDDPAFYSALSHTVSDQTLDALGLEKRVAGRLTQLDEYLSQTLAGAVNVDPRARELLSRFDRPSLAALAPPISTALESRVEQIVDRRLTSDEFKARLPNLVRQAHEAAVALIRNDLAELPNVYIAEGEVRLNLIPIITDVVRQVVEEIREFLPDVELPAVISDAVAKGRQQLADALQARLPENLGQVTLMSEDALSEVQQAVHRLDQFMWGILLLTVAVIAATIGISPRRRRAIVQLGVGITVGMILGVVLIRRLQASILEQVETPDGERVAGALLTETLSSLRSAALLVVAVALVAAATAYLAGKPPWVSRLSERGSQLLARTPSGSELDRWVAKHDDLLRMAGVVVAVAFVFVTGLELVPILVLGGILALYQWAISMLKRRALPAETTSDPNIEVPSPSR